MKLPDLKITLPVIFVLWCVAGVMTHGPVMLAYPAMWGVVGVAFYGLRLLLRSPEPPPHVAEPKKTADEKRPSPTPTDDASHVEQETSAAI